MEEDALTFGAFADYTNMPRTTVYTRLNQLKKSRPDVYHRIVFQDENNMLKIRTDSADELKQTLMSESNHGTTISSSHETVTHAKQLKASSEEVNLAMRQLSDALERSELRYNRLFEDYMRLSEQYQAANDRLLKITEEQQTLIQEQTKAIEARDPRKLAELLQSMDSDTNDKEDDDMAFRSRASIRAEREAKNAAAHNTLMERLRKP